MQAGSASPVHTAATKEEELLKHYPSMFPQSCTHNVHPAVCRPPPPQPLPLEPNRQTEGTAGKTKAI